jgi:hypothetical protein
MDEKKWGGSVPTNRATPKFSERLFDDAEKPVARIILN